MTTEEQPPSAPAQRPPRWKAIAKGAAGVAAFAASIASVIAVIDPFGSSQDRIAAAATKLTDAGSSQIDLEIIGRSGSQPTRTVQARGEFDFRGETGDLTFSNGQRQIFLKPFAYIVQPSHPSTWCRYDLSSLGRGFLFGALTGFQDDPGVALVNLKERGTYKRVGDETLFGVTTTHYAGSLDLAKVSEQETNPTVRQAINLLSAANGGRLPVDVWLSSDNALRRLHATLKFPADAAAGSNPAQFDLTFDFSRYGIAVRPPRPPRPSAVADPGTHGCPDLFQRPSGPT